MDQATQATTPTAPAYEGDETFAHAAAVAASVVGPLPADLRPSSVRTDSLLPSGWAVTIIFLSHQAAGLYAVAAHLDVPITRAVHGEEIHLEAYARLQEIDVRAAALVTSAHAAELEGTSAGSRQSPEDPETIVFQPVPLGASVLARAAAVIPVEALGGEQ